MQIPAAGINKHRVGIFVAGARPAALDVAVGDGDRRDAASPGLAPTIPEDAVGQVEVAGRAGGIASDGPAAGG